MLFPVHGEPIVETPEDTIDRIVGLAFDGLSKTAIQLSKSTTKIASS